MRRAAAIAAVACAACQGQATAPPRPADAQVALVPDARVDEPASDAGAKAPVEDANSHASDQAVLARLGAIPVWEGVVQRGTLLARRGQRGVLFGRVGPPADAPAWTWLIDDTEGNGCLAARVAFDGAPPPAGTAVAVRGAWALEPVPAPSAPSAPSAPTATTAAPAAPSAPAAPAAPAHRWVWQAESVTRLTEGTPPPSIPDEPSAIGHDPVPRPRPANAVPISKAKDNDLVVFTVLSAPQSLGEGWVIADALGNPPVAVLYLPGDRPSYGGIDFRHPDEGWRLRRGVTYAVRIGRVRKKDPTKPAQINARGAPIKVT